MQGFVPRDAFLLKIERELCHPKCARKVSELSRNRPQAQDFQMSDNIIQWITCYLLEKYYQNQCSDLSNEKCSPPFEQLGRLPEVPFGQFAYALLS